ncbi:MAG: chorismate mutase [Firmicutes bacterium]|nr:chorismate mutase [Bacillota bacterium]
MAKVKAIRGATTVTADTREEILAATRELINEILRRNELHPELVISAFFTATPDLTAAFPAEAVRQLGYTSWAALDSTQMSVPGALQRCIRVLLHVYREETAKEVQHVYIRGAEVLRPDRATAGD